MSKRPVIDATSTTSTPASERRGDPSLPAAVTFLLAELVKQLIEQIDGFEDEVCSAEMRGGPGAEDEPEDSRSARESLRELAREVGLVLAPLVAASGLAGLFAQLVDEGGSAEWERSPFRTFPISVREGFPDEYEYEDVVPTAETIRNLSRYLLANSATPLPILRCTEEAPTWAGEAVQGGWGQGFPVFEALMRWSLDPTAPLVEEDE